MFFKNDFCLWKVSAAQNAGGKVPRGKSDKERKIGHRRVGEGGEITYKKVRDSK